MDSCPVRFVKAEGCGNDFIIVADTEAARPAPEFARAICDRHFGVGADGLYLLRLSPSAGIDAEIHLFNSDGSSAELSGNGTRCVAAVLAAGRHHFLVGADAARSGAGASETATGFSIATGAGHRQLVLLGRDGARFDLEMEVAVPVVSSGPEQTTDVWLGNPQCVVFVDDFTLDWAARGRELGRHPHFPNGTNVDFVRALDRHTIETRFWERGAGHTLASGTGSTASAVAAIHRGLVDSPVTVKTEGGDLVVRWDAPASAARLTGPARLLCEGTFFWDHP